MCLKPPKGYPLGIYTIKQHKQSLQPKPSWQRYEISLRSRFAVLLTDNDKSLRIDCPVTATASQTHEIEPAQLNPNATEQWYGEHFKVPCFRHLPSHKKISYKFVGHIQKMVDKSGRNMLNHSALGKQAMKTPCLRYSGQAIAPVLAR